MLVHIYVYFRVSIWKYPITANITKTKKEAQGKDFARPHSVWDKFLPPDSLEGGDMGF